MSISQTSQILGDIGRYYVIDQTSGERRYFDRFDQALEGANQPLSLNLCALTEMVPTHAFVGSKTLINEISRTEYFHCYSDVEKRYLPVPLSEYAVRSADPVQIAKQLIGTLRDEIAELTHGARKVGILLSGGMDSRIAASLLKKEQEQRPELEVIAFTWGNPLSRDPIYAKRIADLYDWQFEHFDITAETLWDNIPICAQEGCFYPPNHLHAMVPVGKRAKALGVDCILAGSYGDSIGRSEYGGVQVGRLKPYTSKLKNRFRIMNNGFYRQMRKQTTLDIKRQHQNYPAPPQAFCEMDYQLHYLRNMLNTCMHVISRDVPLYQLFTSLKTVQLMWGWQAASRGNEIYRQLLQLVDTRLLEIPWARTGRPYLNNSAQADTHPATFHDYYRWAGNDLYDKIRELAFSDKIIGLGVFNVVQIDWLLQKSKQNGTYNPRPTAAFLWLASLALFLECWKPTISQKECPPISQRTDVIGQAEFILAMSSQRIRR